MLVRGYNEHLADELGNLEKIDNFLKAQFKH